MPLPANWTTITVVHEYGNVAGEPIRGWVSFANSVRLLDYDEGYTVPAAATQRVPLVNGVLSVDLPVCDDPDVNPLGWQYTMIEELIMPTGAKVTSPPRLIQLTAAMAPSVDLAELADVAPIAQVTPYLREVDMGTVGGPAGPLDAAGKLPTSQYVDSSADVTALDLRLDAVEAGKAGTSSFQSFTVPGSFTWNKPAGARLVEVIVFGGGGGGGSGRRGAAASVRCAGGGGGGGSWTRALLIANDLPASCPLVVGSGGLGGSSFSVADNGNGVSGGTGGRSVFNDVTASASAASRVTAGGGAAGQGGTNANGPGGGGGFGLWGGGVGGSSSTAGANGTPGGDPQGGAGGGSGGGITSGDVATSAGAGGVNSTLDQLRAAAGTVALGAGEAGRTTLSMGPGNGGGGGGASITGPAGAGGAGGAYGGGGGGGGASLNGFASGAGGKGADGAIFIITYF